ncbi:MAG: cation:proton antiporter [Halanaeroarchaeum sp.]
MAATSVTAELLTLLTVFLIAAGVGVFVAKIGRFPYTIALLIAGFLASVVGVEIGIQLSHDVILLVLVPPLLFEGAATTDLEVLRDNYLPIVVLAVPGLLVSVVLLGMVGQWAFGFPVLIAVLFAAIILPTDPVSVLALFEELGVADRLSVIVEGESLINDGVGVVLYTALLGLVTQSVTTGRSLEELVSLPTLIDIGQGIVVASLGGLLVGLVAGYSVYSVMINLDEHMTEIVLTFVLAYGSFLLAEHFLHVSGVIATVTAGLFIGNRGAEYAMSAQTKISVFNTWETAAFVVNTFIFLLIGVKTPIPQLVRYADLIAVAVVLVLAVRAVVTYISLNLTNRFLLRDVPLDQQHVIVWGGLHASIPIALVLGLPVGMPYREELRAMVFGVAAFSLVVQGLSMGRVISALGINMRTEAERMYELLVGRARAVDAALDAARRLHDSNQLPDGVYDDFTAEYGSEKDALNHAIADLLEEHPDIRRKELLVGERRVLKREKSAIIDAMRTGVIGDDVGQRLLEEVNLKLSQVTSGESTVSSEVRDVGEPGAFEEFWRDEAEDFDLSVEPSEESEGDGGG